MPELKVFRAAEQVALILADTSVWIDHLRSGILEMRQHLNHGRIVIHPFVTAELALDRCGTAARRWRCSISCQRCEWRN